MRHDQSTFYYLYVKTHNVTGLKYLGYTKRKDPFKYTGSGKYWLRHLKRYGFNFSTKIILTTTCEYVLQLHANYFSKKWDISKSDSWANLKDENGIDGGRLSAETRRKISIAHIGKIKSEKHRKNLSNSHKGLKHSDKTKEKFKLRTGECNPFFGKTHSDEAKKRMSDLKKGRIPWNKGLKDSQIPWNKGKTGIYSEETLKKMSMAHRNISEETRRKLSKPKRKRESNNENI